jgi:hypothetical protein
MTVVFIAWGSYAGFDDAVRCAVARAGCPVKVFSDPQISVPGASCFHIPKSKYEDVLLRLVPQKERARSLERWLVLYDLMMQYDLVPPVLLADWDMLLFSDLGEALKPFSDCDLGVTMDERGNASAAYFINRFRVLVAFESMVGTMVKCHSPRLSVINDMVAWWDVRCFHGFKAGNLSEAHNGSVFDHNIGESAGYDMRDGAKSVLWGNGIPYFTRSDKLMVSANVLHCWGPAKTRTTEFREAAGIP